MKKALRTFWKEIAISASDPAQYKTLLKKPFSSSLRYLFWLLFCISAALTLLICVTLSVLIPHIGPFMNTKTAEVRALYPQALVVQIKEGKLTTNASGPVVIEFPESWKKFIDEAGSSDKKQKNLPDHLLTIDPKASPSDYDGYNSAVLITGDVIVVPDDKTGGVRTIPFDKEKDMVITRQKYEQVMDAVTPYVHSLPKLAGFAVVVMFFVLPFVIAGGTWLGYLLYLVFASLAAWLLSAIMGRKHTYRQVYRMGIYGITLPLLYNALSFWVPFLRFPFMFTLIFLVWMGIVFGAEKVTKRKTA